MNVVPTPNLTTGYAPDVAEKMRQSHSGMAHFARTGPVGTSCADCIFLGDQFAGQPGNERRRRQDACGCLKYLELMGCHGGTVPGNTPSCRYYQPK
jgi:hypothetical protein